MQNNFIKRISPSVRLIILIILLLMIVLAKSLYLMLFLTILILILFLISEKKVNQCVKTIKKIMFILLFYEFIYIIILGDYRFYNLVLSAYKLILISCLISVVILNVTFNEFHSGLYRLFFSLKKFNIDVEKFTFYLSLSFCFIKEMIFSFDEIKKIQIENGKEKIKLKNLMQLSLIYSIDRLGKFQDNLKVSFYKLNYKKTDKISKIVLILFLIIFVIFIFKEVIL